MATTDHLKCSDIIKSIHKKLREEAKILGTEKAWHKHCGDQENLNNYAFAMQKLAVNHWDKNSDNDKVISRISWVYNASKEYFANIKKYGEKEIKVLKTCFDNNIKYEALKRDILDLENREHYRYKFLDVGSCYNPFEEFVLFDVIPIDIAPANSNVLKYDFLNLVISYQGISNNDGLLEFQHESFDIVLFSLLLEYFPCHTQRLKCCLNAYKLLKPEGILVIVTPDSNHVGTNAKIFKSWRYVLAKHGFVRVKYEKLPHLHCMVFRKALFPCVAQRWAEIHENENLFKEILIPQDLTQNEDKIFKYIESESNWNKNTFLQKLDC